MKKWIHASTITNEVRDAIDDMTYQTYEEYNGDEDRTFDDIVQIVVDHLTDPEIFGYVEDVDFSRKDVENACNEYNWTLNGMNRGWGIAVTSQCQFDFDLGKNYDPARIEDLIAEAMSDMGLEVTGVDFRAVDYPDNKVYSQCSFDFVHDGGYDEEAIEDALIDIMDDEGGNFFGIDFYTLD